MAWIYRLAVLFLILSSAGFADSLSVYPGFYYTYGNYSSNASSSSYAGYIPVVFNMKHTAVFGYDNLKIKTPDWNYDQQTYNAGMVFAFDPIYLKFNYAYVKGDYSEPASGYSYVDKTNILNLETFFRIGRVYLGASYVRLKMDGGILQQQTDQITGRLEWIISRRFFLSVKPSYIKVKDGRKLTSVAARIQFLPVNQLLLKLGGMAGKRAYFFNTDLLTLFNQDETQKNQVFGQLEFSPVKNFTLVLSVQHTEFDTFSINYYIAGVRTHFTL